LSARQRDYGAVVDSEIAGGEDRARCAAADRRNLMKGKVAMLLAGLVLGSTGTGLAVTMAGRYEVPRGYAASFSGMPRVLCLNKRIGEQLGRIPAGTVGVVCITSRTVKPDYEVEFAWDSLSVYSPTNRLVYRTRYRTGP
jgi:hypothetical protein